MRNIARSYTERIAALNIDEVRQFALSLPEASEAPHFNFSSFRIKGKIFATVPPDESHLHLVVDDSMREMMVEMAPDAYEKLWWGKKVVGLRVKLALAHEPDVKTLLKNAWKKKAPKNLHLQVR